jgi:hypothetical protein
MLHVAAKIVTDASVDYEYRDIMSQPLTCHLEDAGCSEKIKTIDDGEKI